MANLQQLMVDILSNGKVEGYEVDRLRRELYADGKIDRKGADFLVELHKRVQRLSPGFQHFFYKAIKDHLLADGTIDAAETAWLRQMLSDDRHIDERVKNFLHELKGEATRVSPEFDKLFHEYMKK
jgi:hypothetical protein